jgi:hypothetical protein
MLLLFRHARVVTPFGVMIRDSVVSHLDDSSWNTQTQWLTLCLATSGFRMKRVCMCDGYSNLHTHHISIWKYERRGNTETANELIY